MRRRYKVGGHLFEVNGDKQDELLMANYEPFALCNKDDESETVFQLTISKGNAISYHEIFRQDEEGQVIVCGKTPDGLNVFEFQWNGKTAGWMSCSENYHEAQLITTEHCRKLAIDNALMVIYALSTARKNTLLFHAAVVSYEGKGYMFLGPSGIGKSTHARLWLQYIIGAELVNDDNPIVRINTNNNVTVYGSPWSGKTPCYRNVSYSLGGMVILSQAPYNKIQQLSGLQAYAALIGSISGMRWVKDIANGLHKTENRLVMKVSTWQLECKPDEEAAKTCFMTIKGLL